MIISRFVRFPGGEDLYVGDERLLSMFITIIEMHINANPAPVINDAFLCVCAKEYILSHTSFITSILRYTCSNYIHTSFEATILLFFILQ